jgi:hypothetical protein
MAKSLHVSELKYNKLSTDFKIESVAANLLKYYNSSSSIFIKKVGINDRPYLKDIKNIYSTYYGLDNETIIMETYRESIYDYLPEGLFHPPSLGTASKRGVESVVKEIRKQKEVEENARNFFQPFEQEFFYTEVSALLKETEFDIADQSDTLIKVFKEIWPLLEKVDLETAKIFFYILPFLHEVRGNKRWIERFLTAFLRMPVTIDFVPNRIDNKDDESGITSLGTAKLGITLIPNGKHMDGERNWEITIGPVPYEEIHRFVEGTDFRRLLESIYDYLIPISVKIEEKFITEKKDNSFIINAGENTNRLGYSTYI